MQNYEGEAALLVLATGLGKTALFTEFIRQEVFKNDRHCLILSHQEELVYQPLKYLTDLPCGVDLGKKYSTGEMIVSASVQSLVKRLKKHNPREFDVIIVDEAHHAAAPTYRKILSYFKGTRIFGFTATSHRGDGIGLDCVFNDLLFEKNIIWGIEQGFLTPIECRQVRLRYDMGSVKIAENGDFKKADIARIMSGTAFGVVEAYEKYARGQTIIFAASVAESEEITEIINKRAGHHIAHTITAGTKNRDNCLQAFEFGMLKILVNFGVLTEGVDTRCAETILIARPIAHTNVGLYAQMVGRGLRLHPDKKSCCVIDCVGISENAICTAATLLGKDVTKKETIASKAQISENNISDENCEILSEDDIPKTWIKYKKEINIMNKGTNVDMHDVAWVALKKGGYILPIPNVIYRISAPLSDGTVYLKKNKKSSKVPMPSQFVFDYVFTDLKQKHKKSKHIWNVKNRKYWDTMVATENQISLIKKLAPDVIINEKNISKGDASAMIQILLYAKEERIASEDVEVKTKTDTKNKVSTKTKKMKGEENHGKATSKNFS